MPLPVRILALFTACLWFYMLAVAPASAPLWHPVGFDWVCVVSFILVGPALLVAAFLPYPKVGY